jgi:hypothetical protein
VRALHLLLSGHARWDTRCLLFDYGERFRVTVCVSFDEDAFSSERSCGQLVRQYPASSDGVGVTFAPSLLARLAIMLWITWSSIRLSRSVRGLPARAMPMLLLNCDRVWRRNAAHRARRFRGLDTGCLPSVLAATSSAAIWLNAQSDTGADDIEFTGSPPPTL